MQRKSASTCEQAAGIGYLDEATKLCELGRAAVSPLISASISLEWKPGPSGFGSP